MRFPNPRLATSRRAAIAMFLVTCVAYCLMLDAIPRSFGDESWYAVPTVELMTDGALRLPMIPGRGGLEYYYLQPKVVLNLLAIPFAGVFGIGLFAFRLTAVAVGMFGLIGVYFLARMLYGPLTASIGSVFVATNWWFFVASRTFRPEVFVLTFVVWSLFLLLRAFSKRSWASAVAAGIMAALALLSHQVSALVLLALSLAALSILWHGGFSDRPAASSPDEGQERHTWTSTWPLLVGLAIGIAMLLLPYWSYVVFAESVSPASWAQQMVGEAREVGSTDLAGLFGREGQRWGNFLQFPLGLPIGLVYLGAFLHVAGSHTWQDRFLARALILEAVLVALAVPLPTGRYLTALVPFLGLAVARFVVAVTASAPVHPRKSGTAAVKRVAVALGLIYLGLNVVGIGSLIYSHWGAGYGQLMRSIEAQIGKDEIIAGPIVFWLGLYTHKYVVTNVPPDFTLDTVPDFGWLRKRLETERPDVLLQTTTYLQGTEGLGPRPQEFSIAPNHSALQEFIDRCGELRQDLTSRDFGPVRVWSLNWGSWPARQICGGSLR
jgi:hypothetical protein